MIKDNDVILVISKTYLQVVWGPKSPSHPSHPLKKYTHTQTNLPIIHTHINAYSPRYF